MPKPMLKQPQFQIQANNILSATQNQQQKNQVQQMDKMKLDRLLRKTRSKEYMQSLHKLDVGGHVHNQHKVNEIINTIHNEFPDLEISSILLGIVSVCHLGKPHEVHTLDITGQIIEHYKSGQLLPGGLKKLVQLHCVEDMTLLRYILTVAEQLVRMVRYLLFHVSLRGR